MITSLMEFLELPNFGHMATAIIQLESSYIPLMMFHTKTMTLQPLCQSTYLLRVPIETTFADIIKIITKFIKKIFKGSVKFKRIRNNVSKCNLYLYLLTSEKMLTSAELKGYIT